MIKRALVLSAGLLSLMLLPHHAEAFWYARGWRGGVAVGGFRPPAVVTPYYLHGCLRCAPYYHPAIAAALAARAAAMAGSAAAAAGAAAPPAAAEAPAPVPQTAAAPAAPGQAGSDDAASTTSNSGSSNTAGAASSAAPSGKDQASTCAAGLSKDSKAIYDATASRVTSLSALKNEVVTQTRQLAMSGKIAQATAKSAAEAAGKCLELLAGK